MSREDGFGWLLGDYASSNFEEYEGHGESMQKRTVNQTPVIPLAQKPRITFMIRKTELKSPFLFFLFLFTA